MTHSHTPFAAADFAAITSPLKVGRERYYYLTICTLVEGTKFWSTVSLKESSLFKNSSGFFISFKQFFQSTALGFLFLSISMASGKKPASK